MSETQFERMMKCSRCRNPVTLRMVFKDGKFNVRGKSEDSKIEVYGGELVQNPADPKSLNPLCRRCARELREQEECTEPEQKSK